MDFSGLTLDKLAILTPEVLGVTVKEQSLIRKVSQLALFHNLYQKARLPAPGFSFECDQYLLELLKNSLSNNIENKDEVVKEFVQLWNEIATLPIALRNLGAQPFIFTPKVALLLTYHANFAQTVEDICEQIVKIMMQSAPGQAVLNNTRKFLPAKRPGDTLTLADVHESLKMRILMTMKQDILDQPDVPLHPEALKACTMTTPKFVQAFSNLASNDQFESLQAFLDISGPVPEEIECPVKPYIRRFKFIKATLRHTETEGQPEIESSYLADRDYRRRDRERDQNHMQQDFKQPRSRNRNPVLP